MTGEPSTPAAEPAGRRSTWPFPWPDVPPGSGDRYTPQWRARRWSYFAGPWLIYLGYPLSVLWQDEPPAARALGTALLVVFAAEYLLVVPRLLAHPAVAARYGVVLRLLAYGGLLTALVGV
jgi:hypothetical protein